jgi:hypothetical protein
VRNHDTVHLRRGEELVDSFGESEPHLVVHVLRADIDHLLAGDVGNILHLGHSVDERLDGYLTGGVARCGGRLACSGYCSTGSEDVNVRFLLREGRGDRCEEHDCQHSE